jgi:hypothetical protein
MKNVISKGYDDLKVNELYKIWVDSSDYEAKDPYIVKYGVLLKETKHENTYAISHKMHFLIDEKIEIFNNDSQAPGIELASEADA